MVRGARLIVYFGASLLLGYGFRRATGTAGESIRSAGVEETDGGGEQGERSFVRERSKRPATAGPTLSAKQWAAFLRHPELFRLSLAQLRKPVSVESRSPGVVYHSHFLYGWSEPQTAQMREAVLRFKEAVDILEAERAEVSYAEPGKIEISYGPMANEYRQLTDRLSADMREILGEDRWEKFEALSGMERLIAERGPDSKQVLSFGLNDEQRLQVAGTGVPPGLDSYTVHGEEDMENLRKVWDAHSPVEIDFARVYRDVRDHRIGAP